MRTLFFALLHCFVTFNVFKTFLTDDTPHQIHLSQKFAKAVIEHLTINTLLREVILIISDRYHNSASLYSCPTIKHDKSVVK